MKFKTYIKDLASIFFIILYRVIFRKPRILTSLCYHSISNSNTLVDVTSQLFESQINYLSKNYEFVSADQAQKYLNGKIKLKKPSILLTIDDGYKDVLANLCPYLINKKIPAIFFVLSNPELAKRKELQNNKNLLQIKEVKKILKMGFDIGSHTQSHCNLAQVSDKKLAEEIIFSKNKLQQDLNTKIKYFAYPKGIFSKKAIKACKEAGYGLAFTTEFGVARNTTNLLLIPRISVDSSYNMLGFKAILTRTVIPYFKVKKIIINKITNFNKEDKFMEKIALESNIKSDMLNRPSLVSSLFCAIRMSLDKGGERGIIRCPNFVGPFKLVSKIKKSINYNNYEIGIYKDTGGRKVFIKTWQGKTKNFPYYSLINEYNMAKILSEKIKNAQKGKFRVPRPIGYLKTENSLSAVFEYIDGKPLSKLPLKKQSKIINEAILFLDKLTPTLTKDDKKYIKKRGRFFYLFSLPAIFLYSLSKERESKKTIVSSFLRACYYSVSIFNKNKRFVLVHGDLVPDNIFVSKSHAYILDSEHMKHTFSEYDINYLFISRNGTNLFLEMLKNRKEFVQNAFLSLYIAIQFSTFSDPKTKERVYFDYLKN